MKAFLNFVKNVYEKEVKKFFSAVLVPILLILLVFVFIIMIFSSVISGGGFTLGTYAAQDYDLSEAEKYYTKLAWDLNESIVKIGTDDWKKGLKELGVNTSDYDDTPDTKIWGRSPQFDYDAVYDFDTYKLWSFLCAYYYDFDAKNGDIKYWKFDSDTEKLLDEIFKAEYAFVHYYDNTSRWEEYDSYTFEGGIDGSYWLIDSNNIKEEISRGLGVSPIMINSALVSEQQRKRCYWTNIPNVTQPADKGILLRDVLESGIPWQEKSYCMTASYNGAVIRNTLERSQRTMIAEPVTKPIRIGEYEKGGQGQRIYSVNGKSITLSALGGGQGAKTGLYKIDLPDGDYIIRKLTPVEAERLQTLPDNYTAGISSTQRYKCIGNGWTVDVIAHILGGLK